MTNSHRPLLLFDDANAPIMLIHSSLTVPEIHGEINAQIAFPLSLRPAALNALVACLFFVSPRYCFAIFAGVWFSPWLNLLC
jgi:hypothetical protein